MENFTNKNTYKVIGLMSGTSLDGLDIAYCVLSYKNRNWQYILKVCQTVDYDDFWQQKLSCLRKSTAIELAETDVLLGKLWGENVKKFIDTNKLSPDFIASHGHTVFHQPQIGLTTQIGSGTHLSVITHLPVITDFRTLDVAHGGQGAPLAPVGDRLLFAGYRACLNLGGIVNISYEESQRRIAFDVCPCNIVLNKIAKQKGYAYDCAGEIGERGTLHKDLLKALNRLTYYHQKPPKSLGMEWVEKYIFPLLNQYNNISVEDKLHTMVHHIAEQICQSFPKTFGTKNVSKMLITGGGTFNTFLVNTIRSYCPHMRGVVPDKNLIVFKEALIFAFLGVLKYKQINNCLRDVTGAARNTCGGVIINAFPLN